MLSWLELALNVPAQVAALLEMPFSAAFLPAALVKMDGDLLAGPHIRDSCTDNSLRRVFGRGGAIVHSARVRGVWGLTDPEV